MLCCDLWQCMWCQIFIRFTLSLTVSEISPFNIKIAKLAFFSKFRTHDLEVLSPDYEKALLHIRNIAVKFENAKPWSYRDMLRTKKWDARPPPQALTITQTPAGCGLKSQITNIFKNSKILWKKKADFTKNAISETVRVRASTIKLHNNIVSHNSITFWGVLTFNFILRVIICKSTLLLKFYSF